MTFAQADFAAFLSPAAIEKVLVSGSDRGSKFDLAPVLLLFVAALSVACRFARKTDRLAPIRRGCILVDHEKPPAPARRRSFACLRNIRRNLRRDVAQAPIEV